MDDHIFHTHVAACKTVEEETCCLEIFNYSDVAFNTIEENSLQPYDFDNFLSEKGQFAPSAERYGVNLISGLRLIVQKNAQKAETFAPHVISLKAEQYESMVRVLRLPFRAIEGTSVVGPFFWSSIGSLPANSSMDIIFRKSDTRRLGKTEGWDLTLSYSFKTGITTGFAKGTASSHMAESLENLRKCASDVAHPLALPLMLLSHDLGWRRDEQLRNTRDWVRKLEQTISQRLETGQKGNVKDNMTDIEDTNRALVECHAQVLRKRPQDWLEIIKGMDIAMERFQARMPSQGWTVQVDGLHASIAGRLDFYQIKLRGIEGYAHTTMERLNIQRSALSGVIAHRESIVNLQMVAMITDQRRIAQASKRDGNAMKRLSMLGAIFFPGTYMASIFSMVFFSYQRDEAGQGGQLRVAPQLWIYFAVSVPLTVLVVVAVWLWDRKRERRVKAKAAVLETGLEAMEMDVMLQMRRQTTRRGVSFAEKDDEDDY